jgi:hypothetical protein
VLCLTLVPAKGQGLSSQPPPPQLLMQVLLGGQALSLLSLPEVGQVERLPHLVLPLVALVVVLIQCLTAHRLLSPLPGVVVYVVMGVAQPP